MRIEALAAAVTCSILTLAATQARAQRLPATSTDTATRTDSLVRVGSRVRLERSADGGGAVTGQVRYLDDERLLVQVHEGIAPLELRRSDLRKLKVSRGLHPQTRKGALIGGLSLGIPGALMGAVAGAVNECYDCTTFKGPADGALLLGAVSGAIGAGLGAFIGSEVQREEWQSAKGPQFSASLAPAKRGFAASLSLRF